MLEIVNGSYRVRVLKDSLSPDGVRLTTLEITFPRIVLAELNTHRALSRNSASSRAIPVAKVLKRVEENPFIPTYWGKNQKGMQADEELHIVDQALARKYWLSARDWAVSVAEDLNELGVHKQIVNRLLEPFTWHTVIVSATDWENFFALRCHKDAQPEIRTIAIMMRDILEQSIPETLNFGEWHLPLTTNEEIELWRRDESNTTDWIEFWKKISVGRCTRVSYLTHDGKRDLQADIDLCDQLRSSGHMSPFEHVATPMSNEYTQFSDWDVRPEDRKKARAEQRYGNFHGWLQYRKLIPYESDFSRVV